MVFSVDNRAGVKKKTVIYGTAEREEQRAMYNPEHVPDMDGSENVSQRYLTPEEGAGK